MKMWCGNLKKFSLSKPVGQKLKISSSNISDAVLKTKVLVPRRLEDKQQSLDLGLETQSLGLGLDKKSLERFQDFSIF